MAESRKVTDLVWRKDLYPRFAPNAAMIQQYAGGIELLPPIEINQRNEIIDGYHRWVAHKKAEAEDIPVTVTRTESDRELQLLAIRRNAKHGLQLSSAEKKELVVGLYTGKSEEIAEFANLFSVTEVTIRDWTSRKRKDLKEKRNRLIQEMWFACYTEKEIAEAVGMKRKGIEALLAEWAEKKEFSKTPILAEYGEEKWNPPLYNVWKLQDKTNKTSHFGNSEASFTDNLLYMYTEPFDIIVDPFGGGGATIDVCKYRLRRYWVSDRVPIVERLDIRQWDVLEGPPPLHKRWSEVALLFLDPPYWKQSEGQYSKDPQDLANMELDQFYRELKKFISACARKMRKGSHIAMLMQPTQWKVREEQNGGVVDHVVDLIKALPKLHLEIRVSCPYESQQCTAQQVEWAKEHKRILVISRELIVWEVA